MRQQTGFLSIQEFSFLNKKLFAWRYGRIPVVTGVPFLSLWWGLRLPVCRYIQCHRKWWASIIGAWFNDINFITGVCPWSLSHRSPVSGLNARPVDSCDPVTIFPEVHPVFSQRIAFHRLSFFINPDYFAQWGTQVLAFFLISSSDLSPKLTNNDLFIEEHPGAIMAAPW